MAEEIDKLIPGRMAAEELTALMPGTSNALFPAGRNRPARGKTADEAEFRTFCAAGSSCASSSHCWCTALKNTVNTTEKFSQNLFFMRGNKRRNTDNPWLLFLLDDAVENIADGQD
ncbi:hypothetical protein ACNKHO_03995 [Shigella flexneri]